MWWNATEWWPCWTGLTSFGVICCLSIYSNFITLTPDFRVWDENPFPIAFKDLSGLPEILVWIFIWMWMAVVFPLWSSNNVNNANNVNIANNKPKWWYFPVGFLLVLIIAFLAKLLAHQKILHNSGIGDSIIAIAIGSILVNLTNGLPIWLKPAMSPTDMYISTSLVLLLIDGHVLKEIIGPSFFVAWIDTPILFVLGWQIFGKGTDLAAITSATATICGSSAAIAITNSLDLPKTESDIPIAISSLATVPLIATMPFIANVLHMTANEAGAWYGGSIDSTGAVMATAAFSKTSDTISTAAVVKMSQNLLIAPIALLVSLYHVRKIKYQTQTKTQNNDKTNLLTYGSDLSHDSDLVHEFDDKIKSESKITIDPNSEPFIEYPPIGIMLWQRMPKFVIAFIITSTIFNVGIPYAHHRPIGNYSFVVSEWFSTCSFVCIGCTLHLRKLVEQSNRACNIIALYSVIQMLDIFSTWGLAHAIF